MIDESKIRLECGRTPNRGNCVSAEYDGVKVSVSDDREHALPQIKLKEICLEQLKLLKEYEGE